MEPGTATPRPWTAPSKPSDIPTPPVIRRVYHDEQERRCTEFLAEFLNVAGKPENAHANAILAVEAVNAYDHLRAIEAAARDWLTERDRVRALWMAAKPGVHAEDMALIHAAEDRLAASLGDSQPTNGADR